MNILTRYVILRAAGMLVLQLAVITSAQETVPSPATVPASSAPPTGKVAAESSQSQEGLGRGGSTNGAITQPGKADGQGEPAFGGERHPLYRLTRSDTVDVNFTFSSDFNQTLTVQPDGFVALRGASTLFVAGLTVPQMQQAVASAYRGFLREPEVTVTLKDFDKPYFLASGEVARPGKYELRGDLTVNEGIAMAGGLTQQARHSQVILFRRISAYVAESHVIDVKKMLDSHNLNEDLHLQPGDFIYVPQSRISKIRKYVPTNAMSWYMNPLQF
ncbi:MAG TPA: polysaccharide biosynthesis/export family protein [Terriglobales bacterium]|jgi:polysaccharide export outer membrane protein|nr:polysaccharide biosynthesis/export family protein [Terriglobales bacterium]